MTTAAGTTAATTPHPYDRAVRTWARAAGLEVAATGRIARAVLEAYAAAHDHSGHSGHAGAAGTADLGTPAPRVDEWARARDAFARHLAGTTLADATAQGYARHVEWLANDATAGPWDLTTAEFEAWLEGRRWSAQTRRKVVVSLRAFYAWATAEALCEWAPTAGIATANHKRPGPPRKALPPAWDAAIYDYLTFMRAGTRAPGTLEQHRWYLGRLAETSSDPWAVTTPQLATWLANPDWRQEATRLARSVVRGFYTWALAAGHIETSPAERLPAVRLPRALPRPAPSDAIAEAIRSADDRQRLALMFGAYAGLRRAEIAVLHARDLEGAMLHVTGKAGHHRRVPIHPELATELTAELQRRRNGRAGSGHPEEAPADGWLFPSTQGGHLTPAHLGKLISATLPDGWTTHALRHSFATLAYAQDRDLRAVQELLGHAKPETTARYAATPQDALTRAVSGLVIR
jgi:integrase/recombinase XerC